MHHPGHNLILAIDVHLENRLGILVKLQIQVELIAKVIFLPAIADGVLWVHLDQGASLHLQAGVIKVEPPSQNLSVGWPQI